MITTSNSVKHSKNDMRENVKIWYDGLRSSVFHFVVDVQDLPDDLKCNREMNS